MSKIQYLFLHCAYTKPSFRLSKDDIEHWHLIDNGWSRVGYSDLILRDGTLHNLVPFDQNNEVDNNEMTWGVKGVNGVSRHVCLEGGKNEDNTDSNPLNLHTEMVGSLITYVKYTILRHPDIKVAGHYQFDEKKPYCPGFNVPQWLKAMGIQQENIYT